MDTFEKGIAILKTSPWFSNKYETALPVFEEAATMFDHQHLPREAGMAYIQCALCAEVLHNPYVAASCYMEAGTRFVKCGDHSKGIRQLEKSLALFTRLNLWLESATTSLAIASSYDSLNNFNAIEFYKQAAFYYTHCRMDSKRDHCKEQMGYFYTRENQYAEAANMFRQIATSTKNVITRRNQFMNLIVCHLHLGNAMQTCSEYRHYFTERDYEYIHALVRASTKADVLENLSRLPLLSTWATRELEQYASTFT
jgi:tetratricopeptide (TPR) repeat protein